jgi:GT2 family glycosyltransferase
MAEVSVIVPAQDASGTLGRTLEALSAQDLPGDFQVLVVDDGSRDGTAAVAEATGGQVRLERQDRLGPAAARNRGADEAGGDVLVFTDADCFPERDWLRRGLECLREADLVQGAVWPDPTVPLGPFDRTLWVFTEVGLYESANLFVRREAFERVGGFEKWLEPVAGKAMAEDLWFGWKLRRMGGRTRFCAEAVVHHAVFPRAAGAYVEEYRRRANFPEIAAKVPELRSTFLFARWFLSRQTAAFDLAVAGVLLATLRRSPLTLLLTAPYARLVHRHCRAHGWTARRVLPVQVAADAVGLVALVWGSLRARSLVV